MRLSGANNHGNRAISWAQRADSVREASAVSAVRLCHGILPLFTRVPSAPSSAGRNVSAATHHDDDEQRRDQPERAHVGNAHQPECDHGETHGDAGEQDRRPRCRHGAAHRLLRSASLEETLAIAAEDEQRVVDADTEAQHHAEHRSDETDLEMMLEDDRDGRRHPHAEQRDADRHEHRHDGTEREQQDDDRQPETDVVGVLGQRGLGAVERVGDHAADHDVDVRLLGRRDGLFEVVPQVRVVGDGPRQLAGAVA